MEDAHHVAVAADEKGRFERRRRPQRHLDGRGVDVPGDAAGRVAAVRGAVRATVAGRDPEVFA